MRNDETKADLGFRSAPDAASLRLRRNVFPAVLGTALVSTAILFAVLGHNSHHAKATRERLLQAMTKASAWLATDYTVFSPARLADRAADFSVPSLGRGTLPIATAKPATPARRATPETISTKVAVGRGDTLMKLLTGAGADLNESTEAISALRAVVDPKRLQRGQEITLTFSANGDQTKLVGLSMEPSPERSVALSRGIDGGFDAKEVVRPLAPTFVRAGGTIDSSVFQAAQSANIPPSVMAEMIRLFSYDVDFQREVQPGDSFEVYFERMVDGGGRAVKSGRIIYAAMTLSGHTLQYYRYKPSDEADADYFTASGQSIRKALLRTPVDGARLTSGFGMRHHPLLGFTAMHKGVDFGAAYGTPIMAAGDGTIELAGWNGAYGKYVRIRHNGMYSTAYAHMSTIANIHPGQRVHQGDVIGYVGATGRATGPHLHYEVLVNNAQVNPLSVRLPTGRKLDGKELERFRHETAGLVEQVEKAPLLTKVAGN